MGYYLPIHGIYLGDILFTNHLPTSWNIQVQPYQTLISGWGTLGGGWLIGRNVTSSHSVFMCMYGWEQLGMGKIQTTYIHTMS